MASWFFCPHCGYENKYGTKECRACGRLVAGVPGLEESKRHEPPVWEKPTLRFGVMPSPYKEVIRQALHEGETLVDFLRGQTGRFGSPIWVFLTRHGVTFFTERGTGELAYLRLSDIRIVEVRDGNPALSFLTSTGAIISVAEANAQEGRRMAESILLMQRVAAGIPESTTRVASILGLLTSGKHQEREQAARELRVLGTTAIPALMGLARQPGGNQAVIQLVLMGGDAVGPVIDAIRDGEAGFIEILTYLAARGARGALEGLEGLAEEIDDPLVRHQATVAAARVRLAVSGAN